MRLSIAIVNWNTSGLLSECLESIRRYPPDFEYETIVVDNASDDFDEPSFRQRFPDVRLVANRENAGYARGNNQAMEVATGGYILLLNPDTQVTEGALGALVTFMDTHNDCAAAGARLVRPDGAVEQSVRGFPYPLGIAAEFTGLSRILPNCRAVGQYRMRWFSYTQEAEVDQPMGSCLILSRRAIDDVGTFDCSFPIFFNEVDWLYRAKEKGYKVYFTPSATIVHHGAGSTGQVNRRKMVRESHESLVRFYEKHFRRKLNPVAYWLTLACIRLGVLIRA